MTSYEKLFDKTNLYSNPNFSLKKKKKRKYIPMHVVKG